MARLPLRREFVLARSAPFSYECGACSRCCRGKIIPLTPYEVARLAEHLGTTTTETLERWTTRGGSALASRPDGACVFLGEHGCSVHAARPLACRLYPLGRSLAPDGTELFAEVEPHPETAGVYGDEGTVGDFLAAQDVERHLAAVDCYLALLRRMLAATVRRPDVSAVRDQASQALERAPTASDDNLLDMDAVVARWCAEHGVELPRDVEAKTALHVRALEEHLERLQPPDGNP